MNPGDGDGRTGATDSAPFPDSDPADDDGAGSRDGLLLGGFALYVALLLLGAFGQLTGNRAILDLLDARRLFSQ